jgi:hypothetical protein
VSDVVEKVTGRVPCRLADFMRAHGAAFGAAGGQSLRAR